MLSKHIFFLTISHNRIFPGYARDSTGKWQVIVQTEDLPQRVAIDLCHSPDKPCKIFVQIQTETGFNYHFGYNLWNNFNTTMAWNKTALIPADKTIITITV